MDRMKHHSCYAVVATYQFVNPTKVVNYHCSASVTTLQFVTKCCSFCFSFFNLSYLLL